MSTCVCVWDTLWVHLWIWVRVRECVCCEEKFGIFFLIAYSNLSFANCVCECVRAFHFSFCNKQTASWYFCSDFSLILFAFFHPSVCFSHRISEDVFFFFWQYIRSLSSVSEGFLFLIPRNQKCSNNNFKQKLSREKRTTDFLENRLDLWVGFMTFFPTFRMIVENNVGTKCWAFAVDGCVERKKWTENEKRKKKKEKIGEDMEIECDVSDESINTA